MEREGGSVSKPGEVTIDKDAVLLLTLVMSL